MRWSDIPFNPSSRILRQFAAGLTVLVFALALWREFWYDDRAGALLFASLGFLTGSCGIARPRWLRLLFVGWMCAVFPVGWLISHLTLAFLFFAVFTPIGMVFRLFGRDLLARRRPVGYDSYWQEKPGPVDMASYFRQS